MKKKKKKSVVIINKLVEKLNEILKYNNSQFTVSNNIVIENPLHDIIGRISENFFSNFEENFFVIGGPLSYIRDAKFIDDVDLSTIKEYTFETVDDLFTNKLAHLEQEKEAINEAIKKAKKKEKKQKQEEKKKKK
jgi:hypothetical protein